MTRKRAVIFLFTAAATAVVAGAQTMQAPDITRVPTLYVVPYAHLDTQWNWEFPQTISEFLLTTMRVNFKYIDKNPLYVFNWTGANRYRLMKEYYPADYARIKGYVASGRWFPAGSSVEEGDVNLPSAEGIFRQVLYGNTYFRAEFGKASAEFMLPDCFGFPASLPSILAHAGVKGFSTQKLSSTWQPAPLVGGPDSVEQTPEGIPFNVGRWTGPDGKGIIAALNPGDYGSNVYTDLSKPALPQPPAPTAEEQEKMTPALKQRLKWRKEIEPDWVARIALDGKVTGVFADYHYIGTGDIGGGPTAESVKLMEAMAAKTVTVLPPPNPDNGPYSASYKPPTQPQQVGDGPVHIVLSVADQMFKDIPAASVANLPEYRGDLELINHSAGSLTSQAYHKHWVLRNEVVADAAEKASLAAALTGGRAYPQQRLNAAWMLALAGHFHDTAAGTATPRAYEYAWNDDAIAGNQFAQVATDATAVVASALDTRGEGVPVVVYNTLNIARTDVVSVPLSVQSSQSKQWLVVDPQGKWVASDVSGGTLRFLATVPAVGYAVYRMQSIQERPRNLPLPSPDPSRPAPLSVTTSSLENERYRVKIDTNGDVSSVFDKLLGKELLAAPIRLAISEDNPRNWPAWNMDFDQEQAAPRSFVDGEVSVKVSEMSQVRVALTITRKNEGSTFVQTVSLAAGEAGNRVEFSNAIDWRGLSCNLKAVFPLTASNPEATYNWDLGTVMRPSAAPRQFEVASHKWIDLTDQSGAFGATILTGDKNGSDKRDDHTIRLTLLRTPGLHARADGKPTSFSDQANQDWGHHDFTFALAGHAGDWRAAQTDWQAYRLNEPLMAFTTTAHPGRLGKTFSLLQVDNPRVRVLALKKAETTDEVVLRLVELDGKPATARVSFAAPVTSFREVDAQELPLAVAPASPATIDREALAMSFTPYQPRTFALKLQPGVAPKPRAEAAVKLDYDLAVASNDDTPTGGPGFDGKGNALPAEMLPARVDFDGAHFALATAATGQPNAVTAHGQTIQLPAGTYNRVLLLAASANGDRDATFRVGKHDVSLNIQDWSGFVGQWDTRQWKNVAAREWAFSANHAPFPSLDRDERQRFHPVAYPTDYVGLKPGFIKPANVAWYASHHHTAAGLNEPYQYSYLFAYALDLAPGERTFTLPNDPNLRIMAVSVVDGVPAATPTAPLFDTIGKAILER